MYECLKGKKLLILGATYSEVALVKRAQEFGVKVYVTDWHEDWIVSPAKYCADVAWNVSWSDLDTLEKLCRENQIDGVIAGNSEIRVENMLRLCQRLGLPSYTTMEQLETTRDKIQFKNACRASGVPVVREFDSVEAVDEANAYPVIVKPVDRAGSLGISVAENHEELEKAYAYAMEMSLRKEVIIEEYIYRAVKFDAYYEIVDGEIELVSTDDVINAPENGREKVVQSGWTLPSIHQDAFRQKIDPSMRKMISNMGIRNGYIFFSGFADKNSNFVFFECGFRLCGGYLFNYFPLIGAYNNMDIFLLYALTGSAKEAVRNTESSDKNLKNVTVNLYAKAGTISRMEGFDKVLAMPDCKFALECAHIGQECKDDKAILSKIGVAYFCNDSVDQLARDVAEMYQYIRVEDENGKDMIYDRIDPEYIRRWQKGEILKEI